MPWSIDSAGRFEERTLASEALRHNPLGDPYQRPLWVYLPPGYDAEPTRRYPAIYQIQGLTGQLDMWRNRSPFRKTFPELADELFASGEAPPCIVVWVDGWTSLGGSQFLDSSATGRYHTYLCDEVVPWVDSHYRTLSGREHRGIAGNQLSPPLPAVCARPARRLSRLVRSVLGRLSRSPGLLQAERRPPVE